MRTMQGNLSQGLSQADVSAIAIDVKAMASQEVDDVKQLITGYITKKMLKIVSELNVSCGVAARRSAPLMWFSFFPNCTAHWWRPVCISPTPWVSPQNVQHCPGVCEAGVPCAITGSFCG